MKKTLKIRLFIITLLAGIGVQAQTLPKVSFMTYNIQGHAVTDQRIKDAATVINSVSPEVVAIQEVDMRPYLFRHDYLKDLADSTGMHHEYLPTVGKDYGIGLLSKTKPLSVRHMIVPFSDASKDKENRGILIAEFEEYYFISTHYSLNADDRDAATDSICNFTFSVNKNVFVAGDFNAKPTYRAMVTFQNRGFVIMNNTSEYTFPATDPTSCIDMVLYFEQGETPRYKTLMSGIARNHDVDLTKTSDHLPVYVTLRDRGPVGLSANSSPEIRILKDETGFCISGLDSDAALSITDMQGRVVVNRQIADQQRIDTQNMQGIYILHLQNKTLYYTIRLII